MERVQLKNQLEKELYSRSGVMKNNSNYFLFLFIIDYNNGGKRFEL